MKKLITVFLFLLTVSCGFKVVDGGKRSNFDISEITTSGDKKISYKIKNKLMLVSTSSEKKLISVNLSSGKEKTIKEKNIKNEITKYQITISTNVEFNVVNDINIYKFSKSRSGDYNVLNQYSQTLNNEKKLIELLTENLAEDIIDQLINSVNAI